MKNFLHIKDIPLKPALLSIAIEKTTTKSKVVTIGAVIVCKKTLLNLFTSFKYRVYKPVQLTNPISLLIPKFKSLLFKYYLF